MRNRVQWMTAGRVLQELEWKSGGLRIPELDREDEEIIRRAYVASLPDHEKLAWSLVAAFVMSEWRERKTAELIRDRGDRQPAPFRIPMRILRG